MTKQELITWLNNNPGNQRKLEIKSGLAFGYIWKIKAGIRQPTDRTLKILEICINQILEENMIRSG